MRLFFRLNQRWLRREGPGLKAALSRLIYASPNVRIGRHFRCDRIPRCLVDLNSQLVIGNDVEFRGGVELRAHGRSRIIIEDSVRIDRGVRILAANNAIVRIGAGTRIGLCSVLNGGDSITVGQKCLISGFVFLQTSMHRFSNLNLAIRDQGYDHSPIHICDGAWIGAHVVVMPGRTVGKGAVVGSNAVVTRTVAEGLIVAGVPARPLLRNDDSKVD